MLSLTQICQLKILDILEENGYSGRLINQLCKKCPDYLLEPVFEKLLETQSITEVALVSYFTHYRTKITIRKSGHVRNSLFKLIGLNCPNLFKLDLSDCVQISNSVIRSILQGCPLLESITLDRCHKITDSAFDFSVSPFQALVGCLSLEAISLSGCPQITGEIVHTLNKNCRRLSYLNLSQCKNVRAPQLQHVFEHNSLRVLNLAFIDDVSDEAFGLVPYLTTHGSSAIGVTASGAVALSVREGAVSPLRILNLCRSKITDSSMFRLVQMHDLEEIRLPWCTGITDAGIVEMVTHCNKLRIIDLRSCAVTDLSLQAIGALCQMLKELDLSWCFNVSHDGLQMLVPPEGGDSTLEKLSLVWCPQINDATLRILAGISSLQSLQISGCPGVTTEGTTILLSLGVEVVL